MVKKIHKLVLDDRRIKVRELHGEKFGRSARPIRRTDELNTRRAARPLFSRTALPIWGNRYPKLGNSLREILVWGNQCPNFRVDVLLNQRDAAFPPLVQRFY